MSFCDLCESKEFNTIKCENKCSYSTCIKCLNNLQNNKCPNCRGFLYDNRQSILNDIKIMSDCFKARRIFSKKIMKNSIRHKILKICIKNIDINDEDCDYYREDLVQLKKL